MPRKPQDDDHKSDDDVEMETEEMTETVEMAFWGGPATLKELRREYVLVGMVVLSLRECRFGISTLESYGEALRVSMDVPQAPRRV
jgi:hypothetical protein